ncbi:MAG: hypothetical protein M3Q44_02055 [bacterium]|nr:hypothetical protein [bacterium]
MKNKFETIAITSVMIVAAVYLSYLMFQRVNKYSASRLNLAQPEIQSDQYHFKIRSVDTQVVSKHWKNVSGEMVREQVSAIKSLGVNYVAIGTPYDEVGDMRLWVNEIHAQGLHVWFRSHWLEWEGDNGRPASMSPDRYLEKTATFIEQNRELFHEGDAFTVAVEAEQAGVGPGKRFLNWEEYKNFLLLEVTVANNSFNKIGMDRKIHTNWLSMNGWVAQNVITPDLAKQLGLITVDHFSPQSDTIGTFDSATTIANAMSKDLDAMSLRLQVPIFLGEWGYQINQETSEEHQKAVTEAVLSKLVVKPYLIGMNYWVHMGHYSRLFNDDGGKITKERTVAGVVRYFFTDGQSMITPSPSSSPAVRGRNK